MQTLRESGYSRWPYLYNHRDVCFVWYGRNIETGKETHDLSWVSFNRTKNSGKLGQSLKGGLVPVLLPSEHYDKSVETLRDEAIVNAELSRLKKGCEWIGPFLYLRPLPAMPFGDNGTCILQANAPECSAGIPLRYIIGPSQPLHPENRSSL
jgi:hypothetical protein